MKKAQQVASTLIQWKSNCCYEVCSEPLLNEKWILYDNCWQSWQWLHCNEALKYFPKLKLHQKNVMVTVWWPAAGVIHYNCLTPGRTITAERNTVEKHEMHWKLHRKPALVSWKGPVLLHDNARWHISQWMLHKLKELSYKTLPYLPCSPDLLPTNYHFLKYLKNFLQEKIFSNQAEAERTCNEFVSSRISDFYQSGIMKFVSHR